MGITWGISIQTSAGWGWQLAGTSSWISARTLHVVSLHCLSIRISLGFLLHDSWLPRVNIPKEPCGRWTAFCDPTTEVTGCHSSMVRNLPWFKSRKHRLHISKWKSLIVTLWEGRAEWYTWWWPSWRVGPATFLLWKGKLHLLPPKKIL